MAWTCTGTGNRHVFWKGKSFQTTSGLDHFRICFCDNLGVITTLTTMQNTTIVHPNDTTADDRDLFLEITTTAAWCQNTLQYIHIKGHQDTNKDCLLTIPKQHNVDCNQLAKEHVKSSTILSISYDNPAFDATQLQLRIDRNVICHWFIPVLCQAHTSPDYFEYLQLWFNWTSTDCKTIHWQALQLALQSFPRMTSIKLYYSSTTNGLLCMDQSKSDNT